MIRKQDGSRAEGSEDGRDVPQRVWSALTKLRAPAYAGRSGLRKNAVHQTLSEAGELKRD
jgi:hypothetical protein